jgi:hypothetical protein
MKNAAKIVQGASLYLFAQLTEAEKAMAQKAEQARESCGARGSAGAVDSPIIRVSICERSFGEPKFLF